MGGRSPASVEIHVSLRKRVSGRLRLDGCRHAQRCRSGWAMHAQLAGSAAVAIGRIESTCEKTMDGMP
jgi:hypothetical protein